MSTNKSDVIVDNQTHLLDELQTLLEKQVEMAKRGNLRDVELLSGKSGSLVEKVRQTGVFDAANPAFNGKRRKQLQKLYEDLCLTIEAQKAGVSVELSRVRKGKKTVQTYRSHI
jgi:hypothetical protein